MALAEVVARSTGDAEDDLSFYFPDVECYVRPAGNRVENSRIGLDWSSARISFSC